MIFGPVPFLDKTTLPLPVTVHWLDWGLWFPSSKGKRNCFSALQKWLELAQTTFVAKSPSIVIEPSVIDSTKVEQAPKTPKNGIFNSLSPKEDEIHWFSKSPAKQKSISDWAILDFAIAIFTVSFINLLSAFSQDFSPQNSSSKHWSKNLLKGPSFSFGPTILAELTILTGVFKIKLWFPTFFNVIYSLLKLM